LIELFHDHRRFNIQANSVTTMMKHPNPTTWTNQPLLLYHGTIEPHAHSIRSCVDVNYSKPKTDFGRGFYTTTWQLQATSWAKKLGDRLGKRPAVVEFRINRSELAALSVLCFVRGHADAQDFWNFVWTCRTTTMYSRAHNVNGWYDVVFGPVATTWKRRTVIRDYDQVSFHTQEAIALLNNSPKRVLVYDEQSG
jgi:hypothetical protein